MSPAIGEDYVATEVMTATPQKLQLMLIEAALRLSLQAKHYWGQQQFEAAHNALIRGQGIVAELMASLDPTSEQELVRRVSSVYLFVYRALITANLQRSEAKLNEAVRVLEIERETWRQVCDQLGSEQPAASRPSHLVFDA